ncbi:MAG: Protein of unknown function (DUF1553)/Protein of unknown function (DUF1549)/Planctomycete [Chthonomonadaceae bacterium]|nr:Protein of unknown function (DUF1553)/Protein of unknown function (DUF1549)/Planctomycete [Chthonomonadaceae bacterium]
MRGLSALAGTIVLGCVGSRAGAQATGADAEFFEKRVRPVLVESCARCHSADSKPPMGGLRLDSRAGLVKGGARGSALMPEAPAKSLLLRAISYSDAALQMPPTGKLSAEQIGVLTEWVQRGAPWPALKSAPAATSGGIQPFDLRARAKHWAWQPVRQPALPTVKQKAWSRNPVDLFVLAKLEAKGLTPAAPADKPTLLRRVTYDLTGLPPTPAELHAFLADTSPKAYEKVVDRLLASPHYGERWARHWLDLVRYAETDGHEWDIEKAGAYQYRDYLIRAFNADIPYNQFVTEQIAGDLLPHPRLNPQSQFNESVLGTGFYWLGAGKHAPVDLCDDEAERIDNQIDVLGKAFLGVGIGCARCHDHKFDAISTADYYALYGFLKSTRLQWAPVGVPVAPDLLRDLQTVREQAQQTLRQTAAQLLRQAADPLQLDWAARLQAARKNRVDPLYVVAVLREGEAARSPEAFARARQDLVRQLQGDMERATKEQRETLWLEGFGAGGVYKSWTVSGDAFGSGPTTALTARVEGDKEAKVRAVFASGIARSDGLTDKMPGTLRSPTFTLTRPNILYHISGRNAHIRLILEGYQRLRDPLYGRLEMEINSPDRLTWMTQNVQEWIGHRAYIEIDKRGDGYAALDRIGFSAGGPPSDALDPQIVRLLDDPSLTSLDAVLYKISALFQQVAAPTFAAAGPAERKAVDALLGWALQTRALPKSDAAHLADLLRDGAKLEARLSTPQPALAAGDGDGVNEPVHIRGNYRTPGRVVARRFLEVCDRAPALGTETGSGRLQLAQRMTAASNPLLARVMVNRLWQNHFGEGIVRTPDDFGVMGERPTHPELVDYLASEFVRQGWSLKKMQRLMVLSRTYRMASDPDPKAEAADPQDRLLHRMPIRRLEAECIRDGILAVSGRLDPKLYGSPIMPNLNAFTPGRGAPPSGPLDGDGRRTIYLSVRRNFLIPMLLAFDYPVPVTTQGRRSVSNVPSQALTLLNDPFVVAEAQEWAKHTLAEPGTPDQRIDRLYETAFSRLPKPVEREAARAFLAAQGQEYGKPDDPRAWSDLCHVLFNVKEFIFLH